MKKSIISFGALLAVAFLSATSINAQGYTYVAESFETSAWATATATTNSIVATTGTWSVAKNNIQVDISTVNITTPIVAQDGTYGLVFATKTAGLVSPTLTKGAGVLTYYAMYSGGSRTVTVETTTDNTTWTAVETAVAAASKSLTWGLHTVTINDANVKNIRFSSNSNGGFYVDNVLITEAPVQTAINSKSENGVSISSSVVENELTVTGNGKVEVVALSGSTLISTEISGSETINLSSLSTGFYVVKVQGEAFKIYKK